MTPVSGKVALVSGASRGIGKGIALQLGEAGFTVYITGRTLEPSDAPQTPGSLRATAAEIIARGGRSIPAQCDHTKDADINRVFEQIQADEGRLDILVNNAYSAVPTLLKLFGKPFWEIDTSIWDDCNDVGLRNHYICAAKAASIMVKQKSGLIVNISSVGGKKYEGTPAYGIGKAASDRMAADCGLELKSHNVAFISLWPGPVKTEIVTATDKLTKAGAIAPPTGETLNLSGGSKLLEAFGQGESTEFAGKCILALFQDKNLIEKTGQIFKTADLGRGYGLKDIDDGVTVSVIDKGQFTPKGVQLQFTTTTRPLLFRDTAVTMIQGFPWCDGILPHCQWKNSAFSKNSFGLIGLPGTTQCHEMLAYMEAICADLGVPLAPEKTVKPTTKLDFLGITLDTDNFTLSVPDGKVEELIECLSTFHNRKKATKRKILSLAGKLSWCTKCIPAGRIFLRRVLDLARKSRRLDHALKLTPGFFDVLQWWKDFLPRWNGTASFLEPHWIPAQSIDLYTDAAGSVGCGGFWAGKWFQILWPLWVVSLNPPIAWLEMVPVLFACYLWSNHWSGKRITFHSDNQSVVSSWKKQSTAHKGVMECIRRIHFQAALHNFHVRIFHVPGVQNTTADAISRNELSRFHDLVPEADRAPQPLTMRLEVLRPSLEDSSPSLVDTCTNDLHDFDDQTDVSPWVIDADLV